MIAILRVSAIVAGIFAFVLAPCPLRAEEPAAPAEVRLSENQIKLIELHTAPVAPGKITRDLALNGEVTPDQDRTIDVVPRISGYVREVPRRLGMPCVPAPPWPSSKAPRSRRPKPRIM